LDVLSEVATFLEKMPALLNIAELEGALRRLLELPEIDPRIILVIIALAFSQTPVR
jgi:hypothetical protein